MGAHSAMQTLRGESLQKAYREACEEAEYEYGHDGYNGTISTTEGVVICRRGQFVFDEKGEGAMFDWIEDEGCDLAEKRGPARAIKIQEGVWTVYFWAAE